MLRDPRRSARYVFMAAACSLLTVILIAAVRAKVNSHPAAPNLIGLSAHAPRDPIQIVRFTMYDAGIYPAQARVKHGRVVVSLVDYTGSTSGLVVERDTGSREREGQVKSHGKGWRGRQELKLNPGRYVVFDARDSSRHASLIVEP